MPCWNFGLGCMPENDANGKPPRNFQYYQTTWFFGRTPGSQTSSSCRDILYFLRKVMSNSSCVEWESCCGHLGQFNWVKRWWFFAAHLKTMPYYAWRNGFIFPEFQAENKTCFTPPPRKNLQPTAVWNWWCSSVPHIFLWSIVYISLGNESSLTSCLSQHVLLTVKYVPYILL